MMTKSIFTKLLIWNLFLFSSCGALPKQVIKPDPTSPLSRLAKAIELSTKYLINAGKPNGQFIYLVNLHQKREPKKRYNILRHAGTIYALAKAYQRQPRNDLKKVLLLASQFIKYHCRPPLPEYEDMLAIWPWRQIKNGREPSKIKLGGTGLGLVALISVEKVIPGTTRLTELIKLGRFLLYMQKEGGDFYSIFNPSNGSRNDEWSSQYYPSEAALGLLMLYELNPSQRWLMAATKAIAFLIRHRAITTTDQWLLIAGSKLFSMKSYPEEIISRKLIIKHAIRVCEMIIQEQILYAYDNKYIGGFSIDGRTTPTATRLEALLAALNIIGNKDTMISNTIKTSARDAINFLLRAQISRGKYSGGIPRAVGRTAGDKVFNMRFGEVRIDYVQHALSALIQYEHIYNHVSRPKKGVLELKTILQEH
jgi:hypothetical protein